LNLGLEQIPEEPEAAGSDDLYAGRFGPEKIFQYCRLPRHFKDNVHGVEKHVEVGMGHGNPERPSFGDRGSLRPRIKNYRKFGVRPLEDQLDESRTASATTNQANLHSRRTLGNATHLIFSPQRPRNCRR
jgi:hypothetical protein